MSQPRSKQICRPRPMIMFVLMVVIPLAQVIEVNNIIDPSISPRPSSGSLVLKTDMAGAVRNSVWGCVLTEIGSDPEPCAQPTMVMRPFRVTSASLQRSSTPFGVDHTVSILLAHDPRLPPIEIAYLDLITRQVGLGITVKAGNIAVFNKRTHPVEASSKYAVQLTGFYLEPEDLSGDQETSLDALQAIDRKLDMLLAINTAGTSKDTYYDTVHKLESQLKEKETALKEVGEENEKLKRTLGALEEENKRQADEIKMLLEEELKKLCFD